ncbi:MAG: ABC transporter ATP-binding protein [SAR324 cluster bacterium]|nr:ABC transporter ATP-binding protein [SAR324 cluster bacterium]MCZ6645728.1 ABC transporter ATP-binding protein [SAR324 cluster bacterium]MCZ6729473.1 ABC transporter ATP-binding protein [SAR324 cluster bacterium]
MEDAIIQVRNLHKRFGEITALDSISFDIAPGTITGLLGGNGAGKTTTISLLLGLLLPSSGEIRVMGRDILRERYLALPRMNFSSPYVDLPYRLTVAENLRIYALLYGLSSTRARIEQLGEELDFSHLLKRRYGQLSAGQKTRVALAKALLNEPELLLMDEPTASLDPDMADYVRRYLTAYQQRSGAAILLASHNMTEVERMCGDVIILRAGKVVDRGTPAGLIGRYGRKNMEEVFIHIARGADGGDDAGRVA